MKIIFEMAKRTAPISKKYFNFDLESLLDCEIFAEEPNRTDISSTEFSNRPKKFKSKDKKTEFQERDFKAEIPHKTKKESINEMNDMSDVVNFFESLRNNFSRSIEFKKVRLGQFTESVVLAYQNKISDTIKKQEKEVDSLKEQTMNNIQEELTKFEEGFKKLKHQENKLMKVLEQQLKMLQNSSDIQEQWMQNFAKMHKNFLESFKELQNRHKNEALNLKQSLNNEISFLQNKFLLDFKKEEMQIAKKYLSNIYY